MGQSTTTIPLGESFHSRRLQLISSQVGQVADLAPSALGLSPPA